MRKYLLEGEIPKDGFYVYELWNPLKNLPFYVGKGKKRRCLEHFNLENQERFYRNTFKSRTIRKIIREKERVLIKIVFIGSEDECTEKEIELIDKYGTRYDKTGILTNLTKGGEGTTGYIRSEEEKNRLSRVRKERLKSGLIIPKNHTEEWKQHLREDNAGGKATAKPIYQIDLKGNVIKEWESANSAAKLLKSSKGNICGVANKTETKNGSKILTASGFYWRWVGDKDVIDSKLVNVDELNRRKDQKHRIVQTNIKTREEIIWNSLIKAAKELGFNISSIHRALKLNKPYKNCEWKYYEN